MDEANRSRYQSTCDPQRKVANPIAKSFRPEFFSRPTENQTISHPESPSPGEKSRKAWSCFYGDTFLRPFLAAVSPQDGPVTYGRGVLDWYRDRGGWQLGVGCDRSGSSVRDEWWSVSIPAYAFLYRLERTDKLGSTVVQPVGRQVEAPVQSATEGKDVAGPRTGG